MAKRLTIDDLHAFLDGRTFRLRPEDYEKKYPQWPGAVGIELESLAIAAEPAEAKPRRIHLADGAPNLTDLLQTLAAKQGWECAFIHSAELSGQKSRVFGVKIPGGDNLSFEPGGQFEFSSRPFPCLGDALARLEEIQGIIKPYFREQGVELVQMGMDPWHTVDEIGLQMPKPRYVAMDRYFSNIGPMGRRMMRQTCTVQVNLDFGPSERQMALRFLAAQLVAPFATAIFANSPLLDGQLSSIRSHRSTTWHEIDPCRTGFPKLGRVAMHLSRKSLIETFLEFALNAQVVFFSRRGYQVPDKPLTFLSWMAEGNRGDYPDLQDWETHLSLLFPEVRPRGFLEMRSVDCQAPAWQSVPFSFYTGILYDADTLGRVLELLLPELTRLREFWLKACYGLQDKTMAALASRLMTLAAAGFSKLSPCYSSKKTSAAMTAFAENLTFRGLCPADLLAKSAMNSGGALSLQQIRSVEGQFQEWVEKTGS